MRYKVENYAFEYDIVIVENNRGLFNTYVQKTSKLSGAYLGEAVYSTNKKVAPVGLTFDDIKGLQYYK